MSVTTFVPWTGVSGTLAAGVWPDNRRAAVSLTYDDGLNSQLDNVLPQLDAMGLKATFFLTMENMKARAADWRRAALGGHEMADHTATHPCMLSRFSAAAFKRTQLEPTERFNNENFGPDRIRTFAYPCGLDGLGIGSPRRRHARYVAALSGSFSAARTVNGPPNDPRSVVAQRFGLHALEPTYDADTLRLAIRYLTSALRQAGWAILVFHDVFPRRRMVGETSLVVHQAILEWIAAKPLWCAPMGKAFDHISRTVV